MLVLLLVDVVHGGGDGPSNGGDDGPVCTCNGGSVDCVFPDLEQEGVNNLTPPKCFCGTLECLADPCCVDAVRPPPGPPPTPVPAPVCDCLQSNGRNDAGCTEQTQTCRCPILGNPNCDYDLCCPNPPVMPGRRQRQRQLNNGQNNHHEYDEQDNHHEYDEQDTTTTTTTTITYTTNKNVITTGRNLWYPVLNVLSHNRTTTTSTTTTGVSTGVSTEVDGTTTTSTTSNSNKPCVRYEQHQDKYIYMDVVADNKYCPASTMYNIAVRVEDGHVYGVANIAIKQEQEQEQEQHNGAANEFRWEFWPPSLLFLSGRWWACTLEEQRITYDPVSHGSVCGRWQNSYLGLLFDLQGSSKLSYYGIMF